MTENYETSVPVSKVWHSPSYGNVIALKDGRLMWAWGSGSGDPVKPIHANLSSDGGRTWSDPKPLKLTTGEDMMSVMDGNLLRLRSGGLGFVHRARSWRNGEDPHHCGQMHYHKSLDEGETWSPPVAVNPDNRREFLTNETCTVLTDGRIIVPTYDFFGPVPTSADTKRTRRYGETFISASMHPMSTSYVYYSDDEGESWHRSRNEVYVQIDNGTQGNYVMGEAAIEELNDGRLLMIARTTMGRFFQSVSEDRGELWQQATPTDLACTPSPCTLKRIPATGDLLIIWNQISRWESMLGLFRHRMSCAVSKDEGATWQHHRNLESLDDTTHVEPVGMDTLLLGEVRQPLDRERYHRAPGVLRFSYPTCTFLNDTAVITYGASVLGDPAVITATYGMDIADVAKKVGFEPNPKNPDKPLGHNKVRVIGTDWFYGDSARR